MVAGGEGRILIRPNHVQNNLAGSSFLNTCLRYWRSLLCQLRLLLVELLNPRSKRTYTAYLWMAVLALSALGIGYDLITSGRIGYPTGFYPGY